MLDILHAQAKRHSQTLSSSDVTCTSTAASVSTTDSAYATAYILMVDRAERPAEAFTLQMCTDSVNTDPIHAADDKTDPT